MVVESAGSVRRVLKSRGVRFAVQIAVSGGILLLLLLQIDVSETVDLIRSSEVAYVVLALAIFLGTTALMAWRWQILLAAKGIHEPIGWLTQLYFIGYAASQILPTAVGGDAVRIIEHSRRRPDAKAEAAGAVVLERVIGATATLLLVAVGLALAAGRYDGLGIFIWIELVSVALLTVLVILLFSRGTRDVLERRIFPLGRRIRLDSALDRVHGALHGYRNHRGALLATLVVTTVIQLLRIIAIWACGKAVGVDESVLVYVILGPLLFLVMLVPFTINGFGVREAFFVAFLGRFGVSKDAAFATGFLFYLVTLLNALPGGLILIWRSIRPMFARPRAS